MGGEEKFVVRLRTERLTFCPYRVAFNLTHGRRCVRRSDRSSTNNNASRFRSRYGSANCGDTRLRNIEHRIPLWVARRRIFNDFGLKWPEPAQLKQIRKATISLNSPLYVYPKHVNGAFEATAWVQFDRLIRDLRNNSARDSLALRFRS